jgi:hypothetical protein
VAEAQVQQEETATPAMSLVTAEMGWTTTLEPVRMSPMQAEVGVVRPAASPPVAVVRAEAETVPVREPGGTVLLTLEAAEEDVGMMQAEVRLGATVDRESWWFGTPERNGLWVVLLPPLVEKLYIHFYHLELSAHKTTWHILQI